MHDVEALWPRWMAAGTELRMVGIPDGYGHYLPEECPEKPIPNIPEPRLDHAPLVRLVITATDPDLDAIRPRRRRFPQPLVRAQDSDDQYAAHAPVAQRIDRRADRASRCDDRIHDDGQLRGFGAAGVLAVVRQVVVVFDGLQGGFFAVEAEVMCGHGRREQGFERGQHSQTGAQDRDQRERRGRSSHGGVFISEWGGVLLVQHNVAACVSWFRRTGSRREGRARTVPSSTTLSACASAEQPTIVVISWTSRFVSRESVEAERSWESFACRHGWLETWTLDGNGEAIVSVRQCRSVADQLIE
nr:hypothetical protein CFP56_62152 [Quercus suber]